MKLRPCIQALSFVLPIATVGAMLGSLYDPFDADRNGFVLGGLTVGALVGALGLRAGRPAALMFWSAVVGAACGVVVFAPLARRTSDAALYASGASLGIFLSLPLYVLALPAFYARKRAERARPGSIVSRADWMSTWAASGASVAGLALLGQPKVLVGQRLVDLSVLTLALCSAGGLAAVVSDARAWRMLAAPTAARADVGLGEDIVEEHVPGATPFRSVDRIEVIRVGSRPAGRRALGTLLALDAATLLFCAAALVARLVR